MGITEGRGISAKIGGVALNLLGGESVVGYATKDYSAFAAFDVDGPTFLFGVGVSKALGVRRSHKRPGHPGARSGLWQLTKQSLNCSSLSHGWRERRDVDGYGNVSEPRIYVNIQE